MKKHQQEKCFQTLFQEFYKEPSLRIGTPLKCGIELPDVKFLCKWNVLNSWFADLNSLQLLQI